MSVRWRLPAKSNRSPPCSSASTSATKSTRLGFVLPACQEDRNRVGGALPALLKKFAIRDPLSLPTAAPFLIDTHSRLLPLAGTMYRGPHIARHIEGLYSVHRGAP